MVLGSANLKAWGTETDPFLRQKPENKKRNQAMGIVTTEGRVFHKGCVVAEYTAFGVRIMSDVWANIRHAIVYLPGGEEDPNDSFALWSALRSSKDGRAHGFKPATGIFKWIRVYDTEFGDEPLIERVEVDGSPEAMAAWEGWQQGENFARAERSYDAKEWRLYEERCRIERDRLVRVVAGRKLPKGTEGRVFWVGNSGYGTSVGIGIADADGTFPMKDKVLSNGKVVKSYANVAFVNIGYCRVIDKLGGRQLRHD